MMYAVVIWNELSPNFNANHFTQQNGTNQINAESLNEALDVMFYMLQTKGNKGVALLDPKGLKVHEDICAYLLNNRFWVLYMQQGEQ